MTAAKIDTASVSFSMMMRKTKNALIHRPASGGTNTVILSHGKCRKEVNNEMKGKPVTDMNF